MYPISIRKIPENAKKYDIKSGIVTFDITMIMGDTKLASKAIVYFDDYGMKECNETYNSGSTMSIIKAVRVEELIARPPIPAISADFRC